MHCIAYCEHYLLLELYIYYYYLHCVSTQKLQLVTRPHCIRFCASTQDDMVLYQTAQSEFKTRQVNKRARLEQQQEQ